MKNGIAQYFFMLLMAFSPMVFSDVSVKAAERTAGRFDAIIGGMARAASLLRDAAYIFHKQEYVDGKQQAAERVAVKFRAPGDIYMKWLGPVHQGRELLFRPGWNDNRLRVSLGLWSPTLNLNPQGYLAMRGNRHSIYQLPFLALIANFERSAKLIAADPALEAQVSDLGKQWHYGEEAQCYGVILPKRQQPQLYAARVRLCVSLRTGLPLLIKVWDREDGQMRLVEDYAYEDVKPNAGLRDEDFNPENSDYDF